VRGEELLLELLEQRFEFSFQIVAQNLLVAYLGKHVLVRVVHITVEFFFKWTALLHREVIEVAVGAGV